MEGAARLVRAYNWSWTRIFCHKICCCCVDKKGYKRRLFHGKFLRVEEAIEPSLINWENLDLSKAQRFCRTFVATIFAIILLVGTTGLISWAKVQENDLKLDSITCSTEVEITELQAVEGYDKSNDEEYVEMYCYCRNLLWTSINEGENPYNVLRTPLSDGQEHCWDWFADYTLANSLLYFIPFCIVTVNFIANTILRRMTTYYGYHSKPEEVYASAINMYLMSFINAGLIIQLVYFKWLPDSFSFNKLLLAEYSEFTTEWYRNIGSTIVLTLMLMTLSPHFSNLSFQCMYACNRCCDRGCSTDGRRTKKLTQEDYEDINTGAEFMFEFRYSNMLVVLSIAFLYSGGLPIMYPTAAVFFFITYWMDKCLLFNCYRKPIKFDSYLAKRTLGHFKFILLFHIIGFLFMYGMTPILQNDVFDHFVPSNIGLIEQEEGEDFNLFPWYFWCMAALLALWIVWILIIKSFIRLGKVFFSERKAIEKMSYSFEEDFFACISWKTLRHELKSTKKEIRRAQAMLDTGSHIK